MGLSLTIARRIRATPEKVYEAFLTPELIMQWWSADTGPTLSAEVDARVGGRLRVRFQTMDGDIHEVLGTFRRLVPGSSVVFSFAWAAEPDVHSLVTIDLTPVDGNAELTELTLTHSQFEDPSVRDAHATGWSGALENLHALFELSIDTKAMP